MRSYRCIVVYNAAYQQSVSEISHLYNCENYCQTSHDSRTHEIRQVSTVPQTEYCRYVSDVLLLLQEILVTT